MPGCDFRSQPDTDYARTRASKGNMSSKVHRRLNDDGYDTKQKFFHFADMYVRTMLQDGSM